MSKNLIISKLNRCNAYQYKQKGIQSQDSSSKVSTSTKTQESPTPYGFNPEFTFKGGDFNSISAKKSKVQQYFDNFHLNNDVIYQKVILIKPKPIQRSLQFQLITLKRQTENELSRKISRKLDYHSGSQINNVRQLPQQSIKIHNNHAIQLPQYIKTQYTDDGTTKPHNEYFFNNEIPYNCKKYKISRQKQPSYLNDKNLPRCQTESDCYQAYPTSLALYESKKQTAEYQRKINELQSRQNNFNSYYFDSRNQAHNLNSNRGYDQATRNKNYENNFQQQARKLTNSSRLTLFRKEREIQMRKSQLDQGNDCKRQNYCSNDNKQNLNRYSNIKESIPTLPFNNLSQVAQKKLKNQYSQRYLLGRGNFERDMHSSRMSQARNMNMNANKVKPTYLNKQTQVRLQSIRKQLRQVYDVKYDVKERQRSKLKITRDQQMYDNNAKNALRRVGSICRF